MMLKWNTWEMATASWAAVSVCMATLLFFVATSSNGLESILYEDLTCEELVFSYGFNINVIEDMMKYHDGCVDYIDSDLFGHNHGALGCNFIREHGMFVQGIVNDVAAVYNIKCADK